MMKYLTLLGIGFVLFGCHSPKTAENIGDYQSETLTVQEVSDHVYQHISFFNSEDFGKVPCNGMIVFDEDEAIVFDTPTDNETSAELIRWVEDSLRCNIKAIIPTHFHEDCLGGLDVFHQNNIPSYANRLTVALAASHNRAVPENGFDSLLTLEVGNRKVMAEFIGEGHTKDNIIGYFPDDKTIFGGCLVKEIGAGKGNLEDANTQDWSATVAALKEKYPDTKLVIPGHGKTGSTDLLDYTIGLFAQP